MASKVEFRILGPLEVSVGERLVRLPASRQRALLAILLLTPGEVVSSERLAEGIWGEHAPPSARHLVQVYVSQLRRALDGSAAIVTREPGYLADIDPSCVDAQRFERLVAAAHGAQRPEQAVHAFDRALELWRGPALIDTPLEGAPRVEVARLDGLRLSAIEQRIDALLSLGRESEALAELERLVEAEPLRERFWAQLMLALYRCGRQSDALAAYQRARHLHVEQLGLELSPALQDLQRAILRHDRALIAPTVAPPPALTRDQPRRAPHHRGAVAIALLVLVALTTTALLLRPTHAPRDAASLPPRSVAALNAASGAVDKQMRLTEEPDAVTVSANRVWVAEGHHRALLQIDPAHMRIVRTFPLTGFPWRVAAGLDRAWVGDGFAGTVTQIDARRGRVSAPLRPEPTSTGRLALAYGAGSLWVGSQDNTLTRVDPETDRTIARVSGVIAPQAVAVGADAVWVAPATRAALLRVDPRDNRVVRSIPLGAAASAIAAGADAIWALTPSAQRIWRINPRTNAVTAVIDIGPSVTDLALARNTLWAAAATTGTLQRINPRTNAIVQAVALGKPLGGITASDGHLWITVQ